MTNHATSGAARSQDNAEPAYMSSSLTHPCKTRALHSDLSLSHPLFPLSLRPVPPIFELLSSSQAQRLTLRQRPYAHKSAAKHAQGRHRPVLQLKRGQTHIHTPGRKARAHRFRGHPRCQSHLACVCRAAPPCAFKAFKPRRRGVVTRSLAQVWILRDGTSAIALLLLLTPGRGSVVRT